MTGPQGSLDDQGLSETGRVAMDEVVQEVQITGFDPQGEPVIRVMSDGSLMIVFAFMPPSDAPDLVDSGPFADFDRQLGRAAGVRVGWDDRESFVVRKPRVGTIARLRTFIEQYRRNTRGPSS